MIGIPAVQKEDLMVKSSKQEWLLVFYSVPSHPVSNRMKIWRKLAKTGAVQLKGAVYVLPAGEEHEEFLQWLIGEVKSVGGDGAFVRTVEIQNMDDANIRKLFIQQSEKEYRGLEKPLNALERKVQSIRKGTRLKNRRGLIDQFTRTVRDFDDMRRRDFFSSGRGDETRKRIHQLESALKGLDKVGAGKTAAVASKKPGQYKGRVWITRTHPFVDRMASAWLIKRFIDPAASFRFIHERDLNGIKSDAVVFDMRGGEFTHQGDLCTFEVLIKAFTIRDKSVKKIGDIVHDLDVKDDKYRNPETAGVEDILTGIRKSSKDDADALERGMAVFEMLYQAKT